MADTPASDASRAVGTGSVLLTVGGLAAAFGVASCCGLPFLLATAGLGTAWLTSFALLAAPHRSILLIVGAACLAGGALLFLQQRRMATCTPGAFCSRPAVRSLTLTGLLVGLVLLYLGYAYA
jgi:mercuric ion transport protein